MRSVVSSAEGEVLPRKNHFYEEKVRPLVDEPVIETPRLNWETVQRLLQADPNLREEVELALEAAMAELHVDMEDIEIDEEEFRRMEDVE